MLNLTPWDQMLRQYVDDDGRVNYRAWQTEAAQPLANWLHELTQLHLEVPPDPDERLALWLNLYNALTIAQVLAVYPIDSIRPTLLGLPNWLGLVWFFRRPVYFVDNPHSQLFSNPRYSLDEIEHGILRPQFQEPRIHFALVCASIGCPLLRNQAYFPAIVRTQLEADAQRFINNPAKVRYNSQTQTLECSKIFRWYRADFLKVAPSIPAYIQRYLTVSIDVTNIAIRYLPYDWSLNQQRHQRTSS